MPPLHPSVLRPQHPQSIRHYHQPFRILLLHRRPFSSTSSAQTSSSPSAPTHYDTLSLSPSASPSEIKSTFYALSKRHHPDRNPGNPNSAVKFVQISEAYHVLSSPDSRARYDRQLGLHGDSSSSSGGGRGGPRGSYSSFAQGPAGARPASGLSRRRGQFRGPPPSFYRNGGWGAHSAKRAAAGGATAQRASRSDAAGGGGGGFSPGQQSQYADPDPELPYWDKRGHFRTHENIRRRSEAAAAAARGAYTHTYHHHQQQSSDRDGARSSTAAPGGAALDNSLAAGGSLLFQFLAVSGCIGFALGAAGLLLRTRERAKEGGEKPGRARARARRESG